MGSRGRKSAADLAVVNAEVVAIDRPPPPAGYTPEQRQKWLEIVNANPAGQFPEGRLEVLDAFVRHAVELRHIGELIKKAADAEVFDLDEYERLLKMQVSESRALASYSVRLGFAYSTAYEKRKAPGKTRKPWE